MMWVIGNWKMNGSRQSVADLLDGLLAQSDGFPSAEQVTLVVTPPAVFLEQAQRALAGTGIGLGAQNVAPDWKGAMTGELSAAMLSGFGCGYALVGHSERRQRFAETPELVAARALGAVRGGVRPVLCVGETAEQRDAGRTRTVLESQLAPVLDRLTDEDLAGLLIAYEPVWAIGTGRSATPEQAQEVHAWLKRHLLQRSAALAARVPLLYGGSVKADNALGLLQQADIDGALIGGASLDADEFVKIGRAAGEASRLQAKTQRLA